MTTETQQHHPLPWTVDSSVITTGYEVFDKRGRLVANCGGWSESHNPNQDAEKKANAAFIVQACNSFEDLLAACKAWLKEVDDTGHGNCCGCNFEDATNLTRAAITKATSPQAR